MRVHRMLFVREIRSAMQAPEGLETDAKMRPYRTGRPEFWFKCVRITGVVVGMEVMDCVLDDGTTASTEFLLLDDTTGVIPFRLHQRFIADHRNNQLTPGVLVEIQGRLTELDPADSKSERYLYVESFTVKDDDPAADIIRCQDMISVYRHHYFPDAFKPPAKNHHRPGTPGPGSISKPFRTPLLRRGPDSASNTPPIPASNRRTSFGGAQSAIPAHILMPPPSMPLRPAGPTQDALRRAQVMLDGGTPVRLTGDKAQKAFAMPAPRNGSVRTAAEAAGSRNTEASVGGVRQSGCQGSGAMAGWGQNGMTAAGSPMGGYGHGMRPPPTPMGHGGMGPTPPRPNMESKRKADEDEFEDNVFSQGFNEMMLDSLAATEAAFNGEVEGFVRSCGSGVSLPELRTRFPGLHVEGVLSALSDGGMIYSNGGLYFAL
ncbi:hypothetical protein HK101_008736 [Irineochytrium annulatum]|nr:hypothetical protein HK101_008736 [Irineochytrium annulatum]